MSTRSTWDALNTFLFIILILSMLQLYRNYKECNSLMERFAASQQKVLLNKRLKDFVARKNLPLKNEQIDATIDVARVNMQEEGHLKASASEVLVGGISDACETTFPILVDSVLGDTKLTL